MARFAHISDIHLGGWKQEPMQQLNFESFRKAVDICLKSNLDFILFAGDIFDSAYPPIEILKETFGEFKRIKDAKIPVFIIAGSHDYSVSGKTFLDVLEKAGFCKNVLSYEERDGFFVLNPTVYQDVAIYGYPGKKSGLEIPELRKVKFNDAPGLFKIFMLHTSLDKAVGTLPIDSIEHNLLPVADYYALGHLHIDFQYENFVYPGPVFPNNFQELEDLHYGGFYIVDTSSSEFLKKIDLKIREIVSIDLQLHDATTATDKILGELDKRNLEDKVVLLRVSGELENGKTSDIKFDQIESFVKNKNAYFLLKNTHDLKAKEMETEMKIETKSAENIEGESIKVYSEKNPSNFNESVNELMHVLSMEKQEDEKTEIFNNRLLSEARKVLRFE
ncbi:DNA repair exonuclease [Candidatus Pacearchaeota archaeon]|nr:DNA repair exonuclease [Candidatus Pacearchaeota archaeon]